MSAKLLPLAGSGIGRHVLGKATTPWSGPPVQGVHSIAEAQDVMMGQNPDVPMWQRNRVLGLFDIDQWHPALSSEGKIKNAETFKRLDELHDVVDSFISKHGLKEKGVRINFQRGPISGLGGGSYSPTTKEVFLPHLGSEVALHELGHAADYSTRMGRVRAYTEPALERGVMTALPIALAAGDHIKEMIPGTVDDRAISFMQDHAPAIMAATLTATTLYPEAKASISAIRHIRDLERVGRQAPGATMLAVKRLSPLFGSYLLGAVPAVVGMALARKYMNQARSEKRELGAHAAQRFDALEKSSSEMGEIWSGFRHGVGEILDVGKQIGHGSVELIKHPNTMRRIGSAAKDVGTSPEFIRGALGSAVPATLGALYMYGTPGGEGVRAKLHPQTAAGLLKHRTQDVGPAAHVNEQWRREHPFRFAGLVAVGAALSGGIMSRFIHDLTRVT